MKIEVGRRDIDDNEKTVLLGTLVSPDKRSETLLVLSSGLGGHYKDYYDYFGKFLGNHFNECLGDHRINGLARGKTLSRDFFEVDSRLRDIVETDDVFYV